jgi:myo-inositol-1(or 4)-monophosphatase
MEINYQKIIDFMLVSGKRLAARTANIAKFGITEADLAEDLAIERGLKEIISGFGSEHVLYAEEENQVFQASNNIWVADPISGTSDFTKGLKNYSLVISHLVNHKAVFAAVYVPAAGELFTAYAGKGAFLNNAPIHVSQNSSSSVVFSFSPQWPSSDAETVKIMGAMDNLLKKYQVNNNQYSMAVNYCAVAVGRFDAVVTFTKDSFPEFAGGLIIQEAGGKFTDIAGQANIDPNDRIFVGGNEKAYNELFPLVLEAVK